MLAPPVATPVVSLCLTFSYFSSMQENSRIQREVSDAYGQHKPDVIF